MRNFMAQLIKDVEYQDLAGSSVRVRAGEIVSISKLLSPLDAIDITGESLVQDADSFIATADDVSFIVGACDFKAVHAC